MKAVAVIPAYNAEKTIGEVVRRTLRFVDRVIVVDDGSRDSTTTEAERAGAKILKLSKNRGKARALKTGFQELPECDTVVMLDADLQHVPEEIPRFLEALQGDCDLCIGSRFLKSPMNMPSSCRLSNRIASSLVSFLAKQRITDPQSGFRAIKKEKLELLELKAERYSIEHILILEAASKGMTIKEVPISCVYGDEKSNIKPFRDTVRVAHNILRFVLSRG
jgi:glycosyltransferase involved in cell wall biosynthesis